MEQSWILPQEVDAKHNAREGDDQAECDGDKFPHTRAAQNRLRLVDVFLLEPGIGGFDGGAQGFFVAQFDGQPVTGLRRPHGGQFGHDFAAAGSEALPLPEQRRFHSPKPGQAEIGGNGLDSFPKQGAQSIREREVVEHLAVQQAVPSGDFHAQGTEERAVFRFDQLKFLEPPLEFGGGEPHGVPKRNQPRQVIHRRAPDTISGGIHGVAI
jgi:hypothetical protein